MPAQSNASSLDRRTFIKLSGTAVGAAALGAGTGIAEADSVDLARPSKSLVRPGQTILFQGDSITDAGRSREKAAVANEQPGMGKGYAWLAAASLLSTRPADNLKIYNRGISGHKVYQLAERWQADCLDLKPDVLSILIGVNDIWHRLNGSYDGTVQVYERDYRALLDRTRKALPKVKLVICEPFVLRCGAVTDKWFPEFNSFRTAAQRVCADFKATWVPFQFVFDEAVRYAPADRWAQDGVHPSGDGAALMAHAWIRAVGA